MKRIMTNSLQGRTCGSLRKWCFILIAAGLSISAMAQEKYEQGKPNDDGYRYLDEYKALKEYIDYLARYSLGFLNTLSVAIAAAP